jgi:hypothetical protein
MGRCLNPPAPPAIPVQPRAGCCWGWPLACCCRSPAAWGSCRRLRPGCRCDGRGGAVPGHRAGGAGGGVVAPVAGHGPGAWPVTAEGAETEPSRARRQRWPTGTRARPAAVGNHRRAGRGWLGSLVGRARPGALAACAWSAAGLAGQPDDAAPVLPLAVVADATSCPPGPAQVTKAAGRLAPSSRPAGSPPGAALLAADRAVAQRHAATLGRGGSGVAPPGRHGSAGGSRGARGPREPARAAAADPDRWLPWAWDGRTLQGATPPGGGGGWRGAGC